MLKNIFFLTCIILSIPFLSVAQKIIAVPQFGNIDMTELQLKECSFEKSAPAMNLVQFESVEFIAGNYDYKLITETICRIKIFNKEGFRHASVIIPYVGRNRTSRITDIEANTYNLDENGKISIAKIDKKEIFRDKAAKDGLSTVRFTFPDVKEGSVVEYRYTRIERNSYFIAPWFFQSDIPTAFSGCLVTIPSFSHLDKRIIALNPVEESDDPDNAALRKMSTLQKSFAMRNIPSFKPEPFMTSLKDNLQRIEFSLIPRIGFFDILSDVGVRWNLFNSVLLGASFFGGQFEKNIPGTEKFIDSLKNVDSIGSKVNAVYQFVKKNISWDKHYSFYADNIGDVWNEKQGNSAEINIIILNLLRKAGVDCYPIMFSTRQNGKTDLNFPNIGQFNNVDVLVFNKENFYILDGVESHISFSVPPLNILNRDALIIDKSNSKWVNIVDDRTLLRDSASIIATLDDDGTLKGETVITYYDLSKANKIQEDSKEEKEEDDYYLLNDAPDLKIDTSYQLNKDNQLLPLRQVIKFHYELPSTNEFYFLNPFLFSTFSKNPFTDSTRRTDIDFGANSSFIVHMEITLPDVIKLEELTRNKTIRTPDTILHFNRFNQFKGNSIVVDSRLDINKSLFDKEDYSAIADFFKNVYAILNEQILLKRTNK